MQKKQKIKTQNINVYVFNIITHIMCVVTLNT